VIDFSKEEDRLEKEMNKLNQELDKIQKKLGNKGFINKAPENVVQKVQERNDELREKQEKLQANLDRIKGLKNS
ncbi:MAG: hypothetical protein JRI61_08425, partial [Deltaproteobacteria bacterium]|nr:hypothetical protein [Deltaproteobacteria bacterium]